MKPIVKFDAQTDAVNIRFSSEKVLESEEVSPGIVLDYDSAGRIFGMEILHARKHLSPDLLSEVA